MLMLTMSDNTASLWLQSLDGTGTRINSILNNLRFHHTRINARTPGRKEDSTNYGWGQTTPREMATIRKNCSWGSHQTIPDKITLLSRFFYFIYVE